MKPWYETDIQRFQMEISSLKALNVSVEIDNPASEAGVLRLTLKIEGDNPVFDLPDKSQELVLQAVYPDMFPFFRPHVFAYDLSLPRHQNPFQKNLCLLERISDAWLPDYTLGWLLQTQLAKAIKEGSITDPEQLLAKGDEQAEPENEYYPVNNDCPLIFDSSGFSTDLYDGEVPQVLGHITYGLEPKKIFPLGIAALKTYDTNNNLLSCLPKTVADTHSDILTGQVFRFSERPPFGEALADRDWILGKLKEHGVDFRFEKRVLRKHATSGNKVDIRGLIAINFPEEVSPGVKKMTGWVFILLFEIKIRRLQKGRSFYDPPNQGGLYPHPIHVVSSEVNVRIPKLKSLRDKTISIVGLGALGAPMVIEFAKAGVGEIRILDYDIVDAATSVRWPFGLAVAGKYKTDVLKDFIASNYPATKIKELNIKLGDLRALGSTPTEFFTDNHLPMMEQFFTNCSIIIDASAEPAISHYLCFRAVKSAVPFISVWATEGALGGSILRTIPNSAEACWMCYQWYGVDRAVPIPPHDPSGKIQPIGCGDLSFTGAGFDLQNLAVAGVRMAVSTLCNGVDGGYPFLEKNLHILRLVDEQGVTIAPWWEAVLLKKHPKCVYCNFQE
jgi:hypothetical protein